MRLSSSHSLVLLAFVLACGCATMAQKPPTPAAQLTHNDLAQLPKPDDERFFILLFGSQDALRRPQYTHTWATLVRMPGSEVGKCGTVSPGCIDPMLDVQTISWLPIKGKIDPQSRNVEPGRNYSLHETMKYVYDGNESVDMWGPYEVWYGFAYRFNVQKQFLDSGVIGYQCVDSRGEAAKYGNGCDCIHAVTDMDPVYPRWGYPLLYYGKPGTARVVRRMMHSPIFIQPKTTHDWLLPRLGLNAYPIKQRRYIGISEEHDPNSTAGLDAKAPPIIPVQPRPKEPTPKSAPGIENKLPIEVPKTP